MKKEEYKYILKLLENSADKLQYYRAEVDDDYNDNLALEIYSYLINKGVIQNEKQDID